MQILATSSEEGKCKGLGLVPAKVTEIQATKNLRSHMGWNFVRKSQESHYRGFSDQKDLFCSFV